MSIESILINNILSDDSRYSLRNYLFISDVDQNCLEESFKTSGILYPVILYNDLNDKLHLIDGRKRLAFARKQLNDRIEAVILPYSTPVTNIIGLICCDKKHELDTSIINRVQLIRFAISLDADESWILNSLCRSFGFKPHTDFLIECNNIYNLPAELRLFCHEKRFSLKQIINLTHHSGEIIMQLVKWSSALQLTASTLDEIASNLGSHLKREGRSLEEFLSDPELAEVFESDLNGREKTERLRNLLRARNYPILSTVNARMNNSVAQLRLPEQIKINWDKTLENKNINLSIDIKAVKQWDGAVENLRSGDLREAIRSILDEL